MSRPHKANLKTGEQYVMVANLDDSALVTYCLGSYPDCTYGTVVNGMTPFFQITRVVKLWRNEECYLAGDPPRHEVEGYP